MKLFPGPGRNGIPDGGCHRRHIALILSILLLLTILLVAFHHHDDGQDHDNDCSICAAAHHRPADLAAMPPDVTWLQFSFPAYSVILAFISVATYLCFSTQNRAPPDNTF